MTKIIFLNALFAWLCLLALPITANELLVPKFEPLIADEIVIRGVENDLANSLPNSISDNNTEDETASRNNLSMLPYPLDKTHLPEFSMFGQIAITCCK